MHQNSNNSHVFTTSSVHRLNSEKGNSDDLVHGTLQCDFSSFHKQTEQMMNRN
jgi:hypothetical protein